MIKVKYAASESYGKAVYYGKCSKITNTKKSLFSPLFVILEITFVKKCLFEILECGLYHEKKRYMCMSKCVRNVFKTQRCDSVLSPIFFLFFNLIKTAAKFMRTESVKCPARAVFAKSRARHVHIMSLNLLTSHKSPLI